jgi:hypothetical protein
LRERSLDQLRWSLQALALPADAQLSLFPPFAVTADELALDFDDWWKTATQHNAFTADQLSALASVANILSEMSRARDDNLWDDSALAQHPQWQKLREVARKALEACRWDCGTPPSDRAVFVQ